MAKKNTGTSTPGGAEPRPRTTARRRAAGAAAPTNTAANNGTSHGPTHQEIAEAAYRRYLSRGSEHGRDFDDWVEAERDLRQRKTS